MEQTEEVKLPKRKKQSLKPKKQCLTTKEQLEDELKQLQKQEKDIQASIVATESLLRRTHISTDSAQIRTKKVDSESTDKTVVTAGNAEFDSEPLSPMLVKPKTMHAKPKKTTLKKNTK